MLGGGGGAMWQIGVLTGKPCTFFAQKWSSRSVLSLKGVSDRSHVVCVRLTDCDAGWPGVGGWPLEGGTVP